MKLTNHICACVCLLCGFFNHVIVPPPNTREYALDLRDGTLTATHALIIGSCFMGHLAKPAFPHCIWEKFSDGCQVLQLMSYS